MTASTALTTVAAAPPSPSPSASLRLDLLVEPSELLSELRALASDRPATARASAPTQLASYASMIWQDQLAELHIPTSVVSQAFESCRREIWLWLEGDRRWGQLSTYLAARVLRRAPIV